MTSGTSKGHGHFVLSIGAKLDSRAIVNSLSRSLRGRGQAADFTARELAPGATLFVAGRSLVLANENGVACCHHDVSNVAPLESKLRDWLHSAGHGEVESANLPMCLRWHAGRRELTVVTDLFRTSPVYFARKGNDLCLASDFRLLLDCGLVARQVDDKSLYHFLNFSYVPAPHSMIQGVEKLGPARRLQWKDGSVSIDRYWRPTYPESLRFDTMDSAAAELRDQIQNAVIRTRPDGGTVWGSFLSGGTDSSSISGILARTQQDRVRTFSIGFDEAGYDELEFSRIATNYYGLDSATHIVTSTEALGLVDQVVHAYEEPAGNASSIATLACAQTARLAGMELLIGGDGGDEIFGGNERYRKDEVMGRFHAMPGPLKSLARGLCALGSGVDWRPWNRVKNFVRRSSLPNPDRFYTDDSFASEYFDTLLTRDFQSRLDRDESLNVLRRTYLDADARSELGKLLYIDLEHTICDNDVVKVTRAARHAGLTVRFPYLDRQLVEYTGRLPPDYKVGHGEKRVLFKRAMSTVLPAQIINKKKQGFGLPIAVWFRTDKRYRALLEEYVLGIRAMQRGYFQPDVIRQLFRRHESGAWSHGPELWYLLMLELWMRSNIDQSPASVT